MDILDRLDLQKPAPLMRPVCRHCGSDTELRFCRANRGVAWACRGCDRIAGNWVPHSALQGIDLTALPAWVRR